MLDRKWLLGLLVLGALALAGCSGGFWADDDGDGDGDAGGGGEVDVGDGRDRDAGKGNDTPGMGVGLAAAGAVGAAWLGRRVVKR